MGERGTSVPRLRNRGTDVPRSPVAAMPFPSPAAPRHGATWYITFLRAPSARGGRPRSLRPGMDMATFQPADNLRSRTFLGLLVAQFLAAFNDQAIHASSMFFAINQNALSKDFAISLIALLGFWLGTHGIAAGPYLVLSTVFLMGTHSAFFVPAKYGAMPEILQPQMLSRGNGVLESLSFLA